MMVIHLNFTAMKILLNNRLRNPQKYCDVMYVELGLERYVEAPWTVKHGNMDLKQKILQEVFHSKKQMKIQQFTKATK